LDYRCHRLRLRLAGATMAPPVITTPTMVMTAAATVPATVPVPVPVPVLVLVLVLVPVVATAALPHVCPHRRDQLGRRRAQRTRDGRAQ